MNNRKDLHSQPKQIDELFKKSPALTTTEIASSLEISWNTAEKLMLELTIEGKVQRVKKAGVNLWLKK
jgi:Mn-dependent DtxR family transcriptional regulator